MEHTPSVRAWRQRLSPGRNGGHCALSRFVTVSYLFFYQGLKICAYGCIRRLGVPTRLVIFPDEGHAVMRHGNL
jgi:hypothetical protein